MFKDKILVGLGCSHTFGQYGDDFDAESCHNRSWVTKLKQIGNFKDSANLAIPGGSNYRSERVLLDFLKQHSNHDDLIVIFTITELARFETFSAEEKNELVFGLTTESQYHAEAPWKLLPDLEFPVDPKKVEYIKYHYTCCTSDEEDVRIINRKIVLIHTLLKSLNIEHYFLEMITTPNTIQRQHFNFKLPFIEFYSKHNDNITARRWVEDNYGLGDCKHWDEDGSIALANYMFNYIKDNRNE
jgi:hypothetical protein